MFSLLSNGVAIGGYIPLRSIDPAAVAAADDDDDADVIAIVIVLPKPAVFLTDNTRTTRAVVQLRERINLILPKAGDAILLYYSED